jgi:hypothetical protein
MKITLSELRQLVKSVIKEQLLPAPAPKKISDIGGLKYIDSNGDIIVYNIDKK